MHVYICGNVLAVYALHNVQGKLVKESSDTEELKKTLEEYEIAHGCCVRVVMKWCHLLPHCRLQARVTKETCSTEPSSMYIVLFLLKA